MSIKSLYLHVPFCKTICGYCDFCHFLFNEEKANNWLIALENEIKDKNINKDLETIYIGGGTPTSLNIIQLEKLLAIMEPYSKNVNEYTIEVNPETIDEDKVKLLKKYNINRVSIGVQTSDNRLLKLMNRFHDFNTVIYCVNLFKKYDINNISVDVMYGIPTQTLDDLNKTLDDVLSLDIPHISIYCLTIEPDTLFDRLNYKGVDEDLDADMYDLINNKLISNGFFQYEISNYSKKGYESKHNLTYWNYNDFYGISLSSSGKENNVRYDNTKDFNKYLNGDYIENKVILSQDDLMFEHIMMGLRKKEGINIKDFNLRYKTSLIDKYKDVIKSLINDGLIEINNEYIRCSVKGLLISNDVIVKFMI